MFDGIVTNVDLAQTILDAAGVGTDRAHAGPQLLAGPARGNQSAPPADGVYYRYWENDDVIAHKAPAHYGYRTDRYKLIYYYNDGFGLPFTGFGTYPPEWELYDLATDPTEVSNVYDDPGYAEIREQLKAAMWREQSRLGDAPHRSQPVPAGCEDLPVADLAELPRFRWINPGPMMG